MTPTVIRSEEWDRNKRLRELGLVLPTFPEPRWGLIEAVSAAVAGRADATDNDARFIGGINAWNYPTRRLREIYRGHNGWEKFEENGVEGVINPKLKLKVLAASTDEGTCDPAISPRNRTPKGPATEKVIDLNAQYGFFPPPPAASKDDYQTWELCTYDNGDDVLAELSCPVLFASGHFLKFSERIFLIDPGEWKKIGITRPDEGEAFEPTVRRK
ncbi:MAG: hypothetical protein WDM86_09670 [Rhizomicrobium sp.]